MTQVVWLRSDLRVQDNPALFHALQTGEDVIACTGIAQQTWQRHRRGDNQATLINNRCHHLAAELAAAETMLIADASTCSSAWASTCWQQG